MQNTNAIVEPTTIKLQFQTPQQLAAFRKTVETPVKTDIINLTVTCQCSDVEVALAIKNFGATVVK